jgi:hypothetical protein
MCFPPKWEKVGKKVGKWESKRPPEAILKWLSSGYFKKSLSGTSLFYNSHL